MIVFSTFWIWPGANRFESSVLNFVWLVEIALNPVWANICCALLKRNIFLYFVVDGDCSLALYYYSCAAWTAKNNRV